MLWRQMLKQSPDREQQATRAEPGDQAEQHNVRRNTGSLKQPPADVRADVGNSSETGGGETTIR